MEAPDPIMIINKPTYTPDYEKEEFEIMTEKKFVINHNNESYLLSIAQTNKDSIFFKLQLDQEFCTNYYEKNFTFNYLEDLYKFFLYYDLEEALAFLIMNIENKEKNVNIEFKGDDKVLLSFGALLTKSKEIKMEFELEKKEVILSQSNNNLIEFKDIKNKLDEKKFNNLLGHKITQRNHSHLNN